MLLRIKLNKEDLKKKLEWSVVLKLHDKGRYLSENGEKNRYHDDQKGVGVVGDEMSEAELVEALFAPDARLEQLRAVSRLVDAENPVVAEYEPWERKSGYMWLQLDCQMAASWEVGLTRRLEIA